MKSNSIIVLETTEEAQYFVDLLLANDERFNNCSVLSLQPNIQAYLAQNSVQCISTADITGAQSYSAIMDKCEELENYINHYLERRGTKLPEAYFSNAYLYYLRLIWRHLLWDIEVLDRCLSKGRYERLFAFRYSYKITLSPWVEDDQLYIGKVGEQVTKYKGVDFIPLNLPPRLVKNVKAGGRGAWYRKLCNQLSCLLLRISTSMFSRKKTLLVPGFQYNMNLVCDDLSRKDRDFKICTFYLGKSGILEVVHALAILLHVIFKKKMNYASVSYPVDFAFPIMTFARAYENSYDDTIQRAYLNSTIKALEDGEEKVAGFKGVNLSELLKQKVIDDVIPYMLKANLQAFGLEKGIGFLKPGYVISQMNFEIYGALGYITKKLNIPSVLISHGSHVYHRDKYAAREHKILAKNILVGDYRYLAIQSPYARELALQLTNNPEKLINIRPTLWGRSVNGTSSRRSHTLTIVHAGTFKLRHNRRYIYETSDEFLKDLEELSEVISEFPELRLIIKTRPDIYELSLETMETLLPLADNIVIESERPFLEVLNEADLLVSFSSTTIEEALSNKVPVLLYGGHGRYSHIPVAPFSDTNDEIIKAVTFVKDKGSLRKYLSKLNQLRNSFEVSDDKFQGYRLNENDVMDLTKWFLGLQKMSV